MSLEANGLVAGMELADAAANLQKAISLLHSSLVKLIQSNPITSKKKANKKKDFSQSLQAIINGWSTFFPIGSQFANSKKYFFRAIKIRNSVSHQSFDYSRYQHHMECLAQVATAIGEPQLTDTILKLVTGNEDGKTEVTEDVSGLNNEEWISLKEEGNKFYEQKHWREAMNCYTRAIHLNQGEAVLYSNRALCELRLSMFDLARDDIEDAIQLNPKNVKYFRVLSEVLLEMKMHKESLEACLKGLDIDPRDVVLNIRERDCSALIASDFTDKNPLFGKALLEGSAEEKKDHAMKMASRYESLHLTSEDIEDCPNLDKYLERVQVMKSITKAHHYVNWGLSPSTQRNEKKAFKIFQAAAKKGSAEGLFKMADFYSEEKAGFEKDFNKAIELCREAANQKAFFRFKGKLFPNVGVTEAENFLGNCYRDGRGVEQCATEAFKWYKRGSRHDCPACQNNLGRALLNGDGCKNDETSARRWFKLAAEQDLSEAQCNYAMMLEEGLGGPRDVIKAAEMLQLSSDQGFLGAMTRLQQLSRSGALGGTTMDQTKEKLKKAAKNGDSASQYLLGQNYLNGTGGFDKDLRKAEQNLRAASKSGFAEAHLPLGKLLLKSNKNEEAFELIKLSAEKGSAEGQFELGILFVYGHGCARDETSARRWLNRAKNQGHSLQANTLDGKDAVSNDWMERAIDHGKELFEFEIQKQLKFEGMSINKRKRRFITSKLLDANNPGCELE